MSDKEIIEETLSEGVGTAIREGWVDPRSIKDTRLRITLLIAMDAWNAFHYACYLADEEIERVRNDAG